MFDFPGITVNDFRIADGLNSACNFNNRFIILCVGSPDVKAKDIGIVPIGIPRIAGPAVLTTIVLSNDFIGVLYTNK